MERTFMISGSIVMFLGVAAGAFGAHGLSAHFGRFPNLQPAFDTAVRYHLIHGLALLAVAFAAGRWPGALTHLAGYLFLAGLILFSGSLYVLSLTGIRRLGAITPFGGIAFLAGWLCLAAAALRVSE
jgi:uncharacterized membrane protein YgdD (TMEM256/DUF423 family)